ncbi:homing endonuclease [Staphylococcus phage Machias]|nr:homing endonuclease [Staphylococcus phage Machias]
MPVQKYYTKEEFMEEASKRKSVKGYKMLTDYEKSHNKIKFLHETCGNEFWMVAGKFKNKGQRCPKCANKDKIISKRFTEETFKEYLKNELNGEYSLMDNFKTVNDINTFLHNKCKNTIKLKPRDIRSGYGCSYCSGNKKLNIDIVKEKVELMSKKEYSVLSNEYKNVHNKLKMIHHECGFKFEMNYNNFRNGQRCPQCYPGSVFPNRSKAVVEIYDFLKENGFNFKTEVSLKGLKYINPLRLDFYIEELDFYLEYDGSQHFKESGINDNDSLELNQLRDNIKNEYCKENNLKLYRINYKQDHLKEIENIIKELQRLNK